MELIESIPTAAVVLLVIVLLSFPIAFLIIKRNKKTAEQTNETVIAPQTASIEMPLNVSSTPVKKQEGKFILLIIIAAVLAILIPLIAVSLVKKQKFSPAKQEIEQTIKSSTSSCGGITITDTLGNPLSLQVLKKLYPQDEIKILINASGNNLTKGRFRVNGSGWQEVSIKEKDNFVANYILPSGITTFLIEAEVFDQEKGWL